MNRKTKMTSEQLEDCLRQLPELTDRALAGLQADETLKLRIEKAANQSPSAPAHRPAYRVLAPALSFALVLAIGLAVAWPTLHRQPERLIHSRAAGDPVPTAVTGLLDLGDTDVQISNSEKPEYRSIWAKGSNGNFPLIGIKGSYYRMLTTPSRLSESALGDSLGTVAEFTTEPSLSGTDVVLSNAAAFGAEVYEVSGMGGTLVAAEVDGKLRVFQRVSFNGSALQGQESLADTLQIAGHITSMELSDVGVITDAQVCEDLFKTLIDCASYDSSGSLSARQSLLIELDNGLTVQLAVRNNKFAACGTWTCPEFFEDFENVAE